MKCKFCNKCRIQDSVYPELGKEFYEKYCVNNSDSCARKQLLTESKEDIKYLWPDGMLRVFPIETEVNKDVQGHIRKDTTK